MKRILIDLTDLELWNGNHGGTQRVVYGIAKQFFLQAGDLPEAVEFIAFSPHSKTFHQTDFAPIFERVEQAQVAQDMQAGTSLSRRTRLKQQVGPYIPQQLRRSQTAKQLARRSYQLALQARQKTKHTAERLKPAVVAQHQPVDFRPDDTVLVLGKPWDNLDIQRVLNQEKRRLNFKVVEVVYDLIIPLQPQFHHPALFTDYTQHMFEAMSGSDLLLPISKSSAKDTKVFCERLHLPVPEIQVIRLGDTVGQSAGARPDGRIQDEFLLCVGTIEIRKNHALLYYVYKLAAERGIKLPQLVIVGSRGWLTSDLQYLLEHDPAIKDHIIILDNIADSGLAWLYENCLFTVYPSFYEGWGLPIAESLAHGKLCLSSHTSSMPEIAGELIEYFSPYDSEACLDVIVKYLDPKTRLDKEQQVQSTYKTTDWADTFRQVYKRLQKLN